MTANAAAPERVSLLDRLRMQARVHRSWTIFIGMSLGSILLYFWAGTIPFSLFQQQNSWIDGFVNAGVFMLLALGLNIVIGMAGLLDLGYAAFFAFGAYLYAFGASPVTHLHLPFLLLLILGAAVAAVFGILLGAPTLRLRGDYLAIVTLGFGEIVPILFLNLEKYTQGTNGIGGIDRPNIFGFVFPGIDQLPYYILMTTVLIVVIILMYRLQDSRIGRAWAAIREDELAAAANGINTVTTKLAAFALGATTAGVAGVLNASKLTIVDPTQFLFTVSFTVLAMVVLGGMGNIAGVAVGAFVLYNVQAVLLKQLNALFEGLNVPILENIDFVKYQYLLFGIALVLMMLFRPEGLFPSQRRRAELHAAEEELPDEEQPSEPTDLPPAGATEDTRE
jgi:ABC-type branched-subunit amino acid transport system permease subunit